MKYLIAIQFICDAHFRFKISVVILKLSKLFSSKYKLCKVASFRLIMKFKMHSECF